MLELSGINYIAVLVVWIIYLISGAFWYSPAGFSKQWTKHTGVDILKLPKDAANNAIRFVALSSLLQVFTLSIVLNSLGTVSAKDGLFVGLLLWFGLTAATTVGVTLYSKKSWKFLWLNSSYFLLVMSIGSVILTVWR